MNKPEKLVNWRSLIAAQKESGQSAAAFCRTRGLREALFYYWETTVAKSSEMAVRVSCFAGGSRQSGKCQLVIIAISLMYEVIVRVMWQMAIKIL